MTDGYTCDNLLCNPKAVAMTYEQQLDAAKLACDADIALLPAAIERKLAFYAQCHTLAMVHGDTHGANNWQHSILMAQHLRDMRV